MDSRGARRRLLDTHIVVATMCGLVIACGTPAPSAQRGGAVRESVAPPRVVTAFAAQDAGAPGVGPARLDVRQAGELSLPQGRVAVSDAFINDTPLVIGELPSESHAVELLIASTADDSRVAAARLGVTDERVAHWMRAGSIPVDAGTVAFFDPRIPASITPSDVEQFTTLLADGLAASERPTYAVTAMSWKGMPLVAFSIGFGDGAYPVYVGRNSAGRVVMVLVDAEILPWPAE